MAYESGATFFIRPRGPMRFGSHSADMAAAQLLPSSDTLFGALCWAVHQLHGDAGADEFVASFLEGTPPFLLSSAMPAGEGLLNIVPMPTRRPGVDPESLPHRKFISRARYIQHDCLAWLAGERQIMPVNVEELLLQPDAPVKPQLKVESRQRVAIDRLAGASEPFRVSATEMSAGTGLAIHILAKSQATLARVEGLLELLGATGIGGERSAGFGQFEVQRSALALPVTQEPKGMLLSLLWPKPQELEAGALEPPEDRGYRLVDRRGWTSSPVWPSYRSRTVTMLAEGSYVNRQLEPQVGGLVDVTPNVPLEGRHRIYRYGFGLFLDED